MMRRRIVLEDTQKGRAICLGVKLFSRYCFRSSLARNRELKQPRRRTENDDRK